MNPESTPRRRKVLRRILRWFVLPTIGICLLFYPGFYLFQEFRLFEPHKKPTGYVPISTLIPSREFYVEPSEAKIHVQKYDALTESSKGTVFYLHGNRGNIEQCRWAIEPILKAGYDVWIMDYRGFGKSTGRLSEAALLTDAQMVYKRIVRHEAKEDLIVWGRSFGSGIAAFIAAGNSPKALVLETPYWSLPDAACHSRRYLFPFLFRYKLPTHEYFCNVDCPVHMIHGDADEKIYFGSSERLKKRGLELGLKISLRKVRGGRHYLRSETEFDAFVKEVLK